MVWSFRTPRAPFTHLKPASAATKDVLLHEMSTDITWEDARLHLDSLLVYALVVASKDAQSMVSRLPDSRVSRVPPVFCKVAVDEPISGADQSDLVPSGTIAGLPALSTEIAKLVSATASGRTGQRERYWSDRMLHSRHVVATSAQFHHTSAFSTPLPVFCLCQFLQDKGFWAILAFILVAGFLAECAGRGAAGCAGSNVPVDVAGREEDRARGLRAVRLVHSVHLHRPQYEAIEQLGF